MGILDRLLGKRKEEKKEKEEEKEEEDFLRQLCGDDTKLYDVAAYSLYLDPRAAIPKKNLETLIEEAEKSVRDKDYREAIGKYGGAVDKAIFEATQSPEEGSRYIKIIRNFALKAVKATERVREKAEKEGLAEYAASLERRIENYKLMSEKVEDIVKVASPFYAERLKIKKE